MNADRCVKHDRVVEVLDAETKWNSDDRHSGKANSSIE
jgi:hypothetical protein